MANRIRLPDGWIIEIGEAEFSGTGTSVSVPTSCTTIVSATVSPQTPPGATEDEQVACDGSISSGNVTIARNVGNTSGLKVFYVFVGRT